MVAPISGPFTKSLTQRTRFSNFNADKPEYTMYRTWYRQVRPFNLPLKFDYISSHLVSYETNEDGLWVASCDDTYYVRDGSADNYNKSYSKFKSLLGETASLSVSLAERKQAIDMISKRSLQLATFVTQLRKLQFADAAKTLGVTAPPIRRSVYKKGRKVPFVDSLWDHRVGTLQERAIWFNVGKRKLPYVKPKSRGLIREDSHKALANNYLEFHFGWSPLIKDIGSAVEVLQNGVPPVRVVGSATRSYKFDSNSGDFSYRHQVLETTKISAWIKVSNPDLSLATQLGFVNPLLVAWELVPYSFVVDWFVNVGDYLQSFTDFLGFEIIEPSVTTFVRDTVLFRYAHEYYPAPHPWNYWVIKSGVYLGVSVKRNPGPISGPVLKVRPFKDLSPRRGFAAVSLLIQKLK